MQLGRHLLKGRLRVATTTNAMAAAAATTGAAFVLKVAELAVRAIAAAVLHVEAAAAALARCMEGRPLRGKTAKCKLLRRESRSANVCVGTLVA